MCGLTFVGIHPTISYFSVQKLFLTRIQGVLSMCRMVLEQTTACDGSKFAKQRRVWLVTLQHLISGGDGIFEWLIGVGWERQRIIYALSEDEKWQEECQNSAAEHFEETPWYTKLVEGTMNPGMESFRGLRGGFFIFTAHVEKKALHH